jgi:hypothetical protein
MGNGNPLVTQDDPTKVYDRRTVAKRGDAKYAAQVLAGLIEDGQVLEEETKQRAPKRGKARE